MQCSHLHDADGSLRLSHTACQAVFEGALGIIFRVSSFTVSRYGPQREGHSRPLTRPLITGRRNRRGRPHRKGGVVRKLTNHMAMF
jgi:hypothetical protein